MQAHFNVFAFFEEIYTSMLNTDCLLNTGGHLDSFTVFCDERCISKIFCNMLNVLQAV